MVENARLTFSIRDTFVPCFTSVLFTRLVQVTKIKTFLFDKQCPSTPASLVFHSLAVLESVIVSTPSLLTRDSKPIFSRPFVSHFGQVVLWISTAQYFSFFVLLRD